MHITRIGLTPVKGGRHGGQPSVELTPDGPEGDRVFCLVDRARGRVLRTVENPTLLQTFATWHTGVLTATLPGRTVEDVPAPTGETLEVDYWGRSAALETVAGPWSEAYADHLGVDPADLVLARSRQPGEVVYGAAVSLVTTSSLDLLADRSGGAVDSAQFRATFTVDTSGEQPHAEDTWIGRRLRLGEAEVEVRSAVPRCAVVDLDPDTGARRSRLLRTLGGYRQAAGEVVFGVDAVVTTPGRVAVDAPVERD